MKRQLLVHVDPETGKYVHRYGNGEARAVVVQTERGLTDEQLIDLDAMLDLVLEDEAKFKPNARRIKTGDVTGFCGPMIESTFPGAKVWVDTRIGRIS